MTRPSSEFTGSPGSSSSFRSTPSQWKRGMLLGHGAFGYVYQGFNRENGKMCAIKEVKSISDDSNSKECLRQLEQEISLLSRLSHPNIVQYYGSELVDGTLSVYLEYASGGSIQKLLEKYGPFKEPVIRSYARQILSGLAYLHGRNIIHRDIKGANILVDPNGEVKLADFGLAKHISDYTSIHSCRGSCYWMAPEVMDNRNGYNHLVDIWSLGCTIIEMSTSKPPLSQFGQIAAVFEIMIKKVIPDIPDHLSLDAKDFLKLCLQHDPAARPTAVQLMGHPFLRDQSDPAARPTAVQLMDDPLVQGYSVILITNLFSLHWFGYPFRRDHPRPIPIAIRMIKRPSVENQSFILFANLFTMVCILASMIEMFFWSGRSLCFLNWMILFFETILILQPVLQQFS